MYCSVHRALGAVAESLNPTLVPRATQHKLLAFAARYPELGQAQYLECRLGRAASEQIDLLVSAATMFERNAFSRTLASRRADDSPELALLRRFVHRWASPQSILHDRVPLAWLEFDHMDNQPNPLGNIGVCLAPDYMDPFARLPAQPASEVLATIAESFRALHHADMPESERHTFARCFACLPKGARWIHLSLMSARTPPQQKLYGVFPQASVIPYLAEIGWAGDRDAFSRVLSRYCPRQRTADWIYLDLPVTGFGHDQGAGLGVSMSQQQLRMSDERDPARPQLLQALADDGVITAPQHTALLSWPGDDVHTFAANGKQLQTQVQRFLDVKLIPQPTGPVLAKAYLGFIAKAGGPART
jgi:hypothetical protein